MSMTSGFPWYRMDDHQTKNMNIRLGKKTNPQMLFVGAGIPTKKTFTGLFVWDR